MFTRMLVLLTAIIPVVLLGCGSASDGPKLGEVAGTVNFDGKPLPGAEILFLPEVGRGSAGFTDSSGKYILRYSENQNGAVVGSHSVRITTKLPDDKTKSEILPEKYHSKSELSFQVKAGPNVADFELASK
ncbi:hypothetical protein [Planctomicrobium sp. SH527]|uniref:hypothetical protein n=1 Tax=Planctomicrobium sp. SH527 TaxID=3448123 RepID=UPI003F5C36CD